MPREMRLPAWQSPYSWADARDLDGIQPHSRVYQQGLLIRFPDPQSARNFLHRFTFDAAVLAVFRGVLAEELSPAQVMHLNDQALLSQVAQRLVTGGLKILCRNRQVFKKSGAKVTGGPTPRQAEAARKAEQPAQPAPTPAPPPPEAEESPPPAAADASAALAQAATLKKAAEEGEPFCEECEKARQQQAQENAQEPPPAAPPQSGEKEQLAAEAKAAMLEDAAEQGAPFCEECEKAKRTPPPPPVAEAPPPPPPPQAPAPQAPPPPPKTPAEAQAEVFQEAAQDAAPFCEACEQARQDEGTQEETAEAAAQAQQDAAEDGTAFCEECAEARQQQAETV